MSEYLPRKHTLDEIKELSEFIKDHKLENNLMLQQEMNDLIKMNEILKRQHNRLLTIDDMCKEPAITKMLSLIDGLISTILCIHWDIFDENIYYISELALVDLLEEAMDKKNVSPVFETIEFLEQLIDKEIEKCLQQNN